MLTRKHYIEFAKLLGMKNIPLDFIVAFIDYLKKDNPKFNKEIFVKAINKTSLSGTIVIY